MEKHTCSECQHFHSGATGNEGMGFCRKHTIHENGDYVGYIEF